MPGRWSAGVAPIVTGLSGLAWTWAELAPQRFGFEDTDDPAVSLAFIAAHPEEYAQAGLFLMVTSIGLVATVLGAVRHAAKPAPASGPPGLETDGDHVPIGLGVATFVGLVGAAFLFGMAVLRMAGGPLLYVNQLNPAWGEAAYLAVQFVGVHLLAQGGILALCAWIIAIAVRGARGGPISRLLAVLALIPAIRLLAFAAPLGLLPEELWVVFMLAIPGAFVWLILLGATWLAQVPGATQAAAPSVAE